MNTASHVTLLKQSHTSITHTTHHELNAVLAGVCRGDAQPARLIHVHVVAVAGEVGAPAVLVRVQLWSAGCRV